jgi:transcriptional regulator with XRE-family HTH domain
VDVAFVIRERLEELGLEQRDLARAAHVTESYVSQLLTRKKAPPAPHRTDIYDLMDRFLKLPPGELAKVAAVARTDELKRKLGDAPEALFPHLRGLLLAKCRAGRVKQVRAIFERQPFGELERLVAQKLLGVAGVASDIFRPSAKHIALLATQVRSWDVDLATLSIEIVLRRGEAAERVRRFEFVERHAETDHERGLQAFLADPTLSATATAQEIEFLAALRFHGRRPTTLYYYRELQSLRDRLHFEHP